MNGPIPFEQQFAAALVEHGLQPGEIVADGKLHRFDGPDEKRGKGSAWYVLHGDGLPAGSFGDWRTGLSETWCAKSDRTMTDAERQAHRQRIEQAKAEAVAERAKLAEEAAAKCAELWSIAANVDGGHAYIERKGVKPAGAKQLRDALLIPLRDAGGELRSLQFIQPDGSKRFKTGGTVAGCYCALGGKPGPDAPLLICEGWATACSLHQATGYPVAAAMNAGNLLAVAQALRAKLPDASMIVCADDDIETAGNPGLTKAREAAQAIG
ncbi:toprim domain-containing protein, partial [Ralstonia pseudosolanacearum]